MTDFKKLFDDILSGNCRDSLDSLDSVELAESCRQDSSLFQCKIDSASALTAEAITKKQEIFKKIKGSLREDDPRLLSWAFIFNQGDYIDTALKAKATYGARVARNVALAVVEHYAARDNQSGRRIKTYHLSSEYIEALKDKASLFSETEGGDKRAFPSLWLLHQHNNIEATALVYDQKDLSDSKGAGLLQMRTVERYTQNGVLELNAALQAKKAPFLLPSVKELWRYVNVWGVSEGKTASSELSSVGGLSDSQVDRTSSTDQSSVASGLSPRNTTSRLSMESLRQRASSNVGASSGNTNRRSRREQSLENYAIQLVSNVSESKADKNAALMTAINWNFSTKTIQKMLKFLPKEVINMPDAKGKTALEHAVERKDKKLINLLIAHGAEVSATANDKAITSALSGGRKIVQSYSKIAENMRTFFHDAHEPAPDPSFLKAKTLLSHYSDWYRFGKSHKTEVKAIINDPKVRNMDDLLAALDRVNLKNDTGSLARRIGYIRNVLAERVTADETHGISSESNQP